MQLISPRPYQMMHSEHPKVVRLVHRRDQQHHRQAGQAFTPTCSAAFAPCRKVPDVSPKKCLPELEQCVKETGVRRLPDQSRSRRSDGYETPPLGDDSGIRCTKSWWSWMFRATSTLPAAAPAAFSYSLHFINEESIAVVSLLNSTVFTDFPTLKILVSHGGGAIPYQWARFEASSMRTRRCSASRSSMRNLYYDTVLYSSDSLELLFKTVGADRCLFGTERPGVGTVKDPRTGKWLDETRYIIEAFDWLSAADKKLIFEDNAKKLFKLESNPVPKESAHEIQFWPYPCCSPGRSPSSAGIQLQKITINLPEPQRLQLAAVPREGRRLLPEVRARRGPDVRSCIPPASRCWSAAKARW